MGLAGECLQEWMIFKMNSHEQFTCLEVEIRRSGIHYVELLRQEVGLEDTLTDGQKNRYDRLIKKRIFRLGNPRIQFSNREFSYSRRHI